MNAKLRHNENGDFSVESGLLELHEKIDSHFCACDRNFQLVEKLFSQNEKSIQFLEVLPDIRDALKDLNTNMVGPATGRKQVPQAVFFAVTGFLCLISIMVIAGVIGITNVRLSPTEGITFGKAEASPRQ